MIKILHIIGGLAAGGAETMLYRLVSKMDTQRFENEVVSLTSFGNIAGRLRAVGVPVHALGMKRMTPNLIPLVRLFALIRRSKPQIVQTWMYHANLLGGLAARLAGVPSIMWSIHHANLDRHANKRLTIWLAQVGAALSKWFPNCIVFCSQAALLSHVQIGYRAKKMMFIPNGLDLDEFRPDPLARKAIRQELGISVEAIVIGAVARFHVSKDYHNFVQAAARLRLKFSGVHFLMCGSGVAPDNRDLRQWISQAGIQGNCHLLGERTDVARLFSAVDIATSSSLSEAFPLSVGEAMVCGTPCVVTDVGDSALIVGNTGRVVRPRDPVALAAAWRELIEAGPETRKRLGLAARRRVQQHFALQSVVRRYESIYTQLAGPIENAIHSSSLTQCAG